MVVVLSSIQLFATLWTVPPTGSTVHGVSQVRILEWVAISSSRGSSWLRDWTHISCISCLAGRPFTTKLPGKPWLNEQMHVWWHKTTGYIYCSPWNHSGSYRCFWKKGKAHRRILLLFTKDSFNIHFMLMSCKFVETINTVDNFGPNLNILKKKMYVH